MKNCKHPNCKQINPQSLDKFYKNSSNKDGFDRRCKECEKFRHRLRSSSQEYKNYKRDFDLKKLYGISLEEFNAQLARQNSCCFICENTITGSKKAFQDHNHQTGALRKILCINCNKGLGHFKDNILLLLKAIEYLKNL